MWQWRGGEVIGSIPWWFAAIALLAGKFLKSSWADRVVC